MPNRDKETAKLYRVLQKVQQGFVHSEKYQRLFDSHIKSVCIHEAAHAVIATMLGLRVAMVEVVIEEEAIDGQAAISSGKVILEPDSVRTLLADDRSGKVRNASITLEVIS